LQFQRRFLQKTARWCVQSCFDFHEARAGNKPAINRRRRRQCLSAPNPPGAKFSRWNIDIFLASDLVALLYFCLADRAVEAPTRSTLQWKREHLLWRNQFCDRAVRAYSRRANDPPLFNCDQIDILESVTPINLESS